LALVNQSGESGAHTITRATISVQTSWTDLSVSASSAPKVTTIPQTRTIGIQFPEEGCEAEAENNPPTSPGVKHSQEPPSSTEPEPIRPGLLPSHESAHDYPAVVNEGGNGNQGVTELIPPHHPSLHNPKRRGAVVDIGSGKPIWCHLNPI